MIWLNIYLLGSTLSLLLWIGMIFVDVFIDKSSLTIGDMIYYTLLGLIIGLSSWGFVLIAFLMVMDTHWHPISVKYRNIINKVVDMIEWVEHFEIIKRKK